MGSGNCQDGSLTKNKALIRKLSIHFEKVYFAVGNCLAMFDLRSPATDSVPSPAEGASKTAPRSRGSETQFRDCEFYTAEATSPKLSTARPVNIAEEERRTAQMLYPIRGDRPASNQLIELQTAIVRQTRKLVEAGRQRGTEDVELLLNIEALEREAGRLRQRVDDLDAMVEARKLESKKTRAKMSPVSRQSQEERRWERAQVAGAAGAAPGRTTTPRIIGELVQDSGMDVPTRDDCGPKVQYGKGPLKENYDQRGWNMLTDVWSS
ncbi:unnamed protein product [Schistocephalus solidus]|uniref:Gag-pol polyprotein n=1 Tax=Schistocephalus solidus TaxID=70667 RepID=A0A183STY9_SCHSO|nr:unnamed protein product [Schistocephalus solidus]